MSHNALADVAPQVLAFESQGFQLATDLRHLASVRRSAAPEAAIFYCARILEALSGAALVRIGAAASNNAFANLSLLESLNLLTGATRYWAHGLRRLGNEVRHIHRLIPEGEDDVAALYLERWLAWFFVEFKRGPKIAALTGGGSVLAGHDPVYLSLLHDVEAPEKLAPLAAGGLGAAGYAALTRAPSIACALIEGLIGRKELAVAEQLLDRLLGEVKDALRLSQLKGVLHNRRGDGALSEGRLDVALVEVERCISVLQPFTKGGADEETAGILGGAWKRKAELTGEKADLERAYRLYRDAFRRGNQTSAYLGVNVATVALLLKRSEEAQETAAAVLKLLLEKERVRQNLGADAPAADYWDAVSLAELRLLAGETEAALQAYGHAFASYRERRSDISSSRKQARLILAAQGQDPAVLPELRDT